MAKSKGQKKTKAQSNDDDDRGVKVSSSTMSSRTFKKKSKKEGSKKGGKGTQKKVIEEPSLSPREMELLKAKAEKDEAERIRKEAEELVAAKVKAEKEGRLRKEHLLSSAKIISVFDKKVQQAIDQEKQLREWRTFIKCSNIPDLTNLAAVNSYLSYWMEEMTQPDLKHLLTLAPEFLELVRELKSFLQTPYDSVRMDTLKELGLLYHEMMSQHYAKLDTCTHVITQDLGEFYDPEVGVFETTEAIPEVTHCIWGNLFACPENDGHEYEVLKFKFKIPKSLIHTKGIYRLLKTEYDHFSDSCLSYYPPFVDSALKRSIGDWAALHAIQVPQLRIGAGVGIGDAESPDLQDEESSALKMEKKGKKKKKGKGKKSKKKGGGGDRTTESSGRESDVEDMDEETKKLLAEIDAQEKLNRKEKRKKKVKRKGTEGGKMEFTTTDESDVEDDIKTEEVIVSLSQVKNNQLELQSSHVIEEMEEEVIIKESREQRRERRRKARDAENDDDDEMDFSKQVSMEGGHADADEEDMDTKLAVPKKKKTAVAVVGDSDSDEEGHSLTRKPTKKTKLIMDNDMDADISDAKKESEDEKSDTSIRSSRPSSKKEQKKKSERSPSAKSKHKAASSTSSVSLRSSRSKSPKSKKTRQKSSGSSSGTEERRKSPKPKSRSRSKEKKPRKKESKQAAKGKAKKPKSKERTKTEAELAKDREREEKAQFLPPLFPDELNLRYFHVLGGVYNFSLLEVPRQPRNIEPWTMHIVDEDDVGLKRIPFEADYHPPTLQDQQEQKKTPEEMEREAERQEQELQKLVLINMSTSSVVPNMKSSDISTLGLSAFQPQLDLEELEAKRKKEEDIRQAESQRVLEESYEDLLSLSVDMPKTSLWFDPPTPVRWDAARRIWSTEGFYDIHFSEDSLHMTCRTTKFGIIAFAHNRWTNLPYQSWEVRPLSKSKVLFSLQASMAAIEFIIFNDLVCLSSLQNVGNSKEVEASLLNVYMTPRNLIKKLRGHGLDVFPEFDAYAYIDGVLIKHYEAEDHMYQCMALASPAFNFGWSRWNLLAGREKMVFQARERIGTSTPTNYSMVLNTPTKAIRIDCTEVSPNFCEDAISDDEYHGDLLHLVHEMASAPGKDMLEEADAHHIETLRVMLTSVRPLSFS